MEALLSIKRISAMTAERDQRLSEAIERERPRLRNFIRKRVTDLSDAEDILQEIFYELIEAYRLMKPVEQVGAWLFRVARNRITDLFRKRKHEGSRIDPMAIEKGELVILEDLLPSPDSGPEAAYARSVLVEELDAALGELPEDQREVFIAHELEGRSFKELAAETGLSVNTLLSRKHYAVLYLRERLQDIYDEFTKGQPR
jgi:RNA polymerase sigma factor (sigma-70 family)